MACDFGNYLKRLQLLEAVLPIFARAAANSLKNSQDFSPDWKFWLKVVTPCAVLEGHDRLWELGSQHNQLVLRLLNMVEEIIRVDLKSIHEVPAFSHDLTRDDTDDTGQDYAAMRWPRLEALRSLCETGFGRHDGAHLIVWSESGLDKPGAEQSCNDLIQSLEDLLKALSVQSTVPPRESSKPGHVKRTSKALDFMHLFSSISAQWDCKCRAPHVALLPLATRKKALNEPGLHRVLLLFSQRDQEEVWRETTWTVVPKEPERKVKFSGEHTAKADLIQRHTIKDLCGLLSDANGNCLDLHVRHSTVSKLSESERNLPEFSFGRCVNFAQSYFATSELAARAKTCLALVLSYSLLDFCGSPWFQHGWTKYGISFIQTADHLLLRPILTTSIQKLRKRKRGKKLLDSSLERKLLFHGILLLEVFTQNELQTSDASRIETTRTTEDLRYYASEAFNAIDWDVLENYKEAVRACLDFSASTHNCPTEDPTLEAFMFRWVIEPLEADFYTMHKNQDPDEVIRRLKSFPTGRLLTRPLSKAQSLQSGASERMPLSSDFFYADNEPEATRIANSKKWFEQLDERIRNYAADKKRPVCVAVLDTGIDTNNDFIASKIGRIECWPSNEACVDKDGHGTQVASLILRAAPFVKLLIIKISQGRNLGRHDLSNIVKAVDYLCLREPVVDIINISWGFREFRPELQLLLSALKQARNKNILIFVAAGNDGCNRPLAWPATLCGQDVVVSIYSTDGMGTVSGFSPQVNSGPRLCTLGEALPFYMAGKIIHRSGTSFATPLAVATAALLLDHAAQVTTTGYGNLPGDWNDLMPRLRTKLGMERALQRTCTRHNVGNPNATDDWYISLLSFFENLDDDYIDTLLSMALRPVSA